MSNEDELPQAEGVPAVDIPDLKKKEKERKKAGAAWTRGGKAGDAFQGARGGNGAASGLRGAGGLGSGGARAAASAARGAGQVGQAGLEAGGSLFSRLAAFLARATATTLGKVAVAAAVAVMATGVAVVGRLAGSGGAAQAGASLALGDISSSINVRRPGDASGLNMARNNGLVQFDAAKAAAAPPAPPAPEAAPPVDEAAAPEAVGEPGLAARQDRLAHDMSMSKLSSSLGQGGSFGGKNIFAGGTKLGGGGELGGGQVGSGFRQTPLKAAVRAPSNAGRASTRARVASRNSGRRGAFRGSRALGRLIGMQTLNAQMRTPATTREAAAVLANDQFDGQRTTAGQAPTGPTTNGTTPNGPGTTGSPETPTIPDGPISGPGPATSCAELGMMADENGQCIDPTLDRPGANAEPWKAVMEVVRQKITRAKELLVVAAGAFVAALALMAIPFIGPGLAAAAIALLGAAVAAWVFVLSGEISALGDQMKQMGQHRIGDAVKDIAGTLRTGAWASVLGGIAGFWFAHKVSEKEAALLQGYKAAQGADLRPVNPDRGPEGGDPLPEPDPDPAPPEPE